VTPAEFTLRTAGVEYHHRGAFFSELYLFASLCLERGVTRIIESGVYHGVSTRVFRAIWPGQVSSIEFRPEQVPPDLEPDLIVGDGCVIVPLIVEDFSSERVGVFLDGPKGAGAVLLREWCFTQPQVRVVAQHDSPRGAGELMHSYDERFRQEIGDDLDARIDPNLRSQYVNGCPGMGVWVRA